VTLVDRDRQFFKRCVGLPEPWASRRETPLSHSFCQHTLTTGVELVISDARVHPELRDNPAVPDLGVADAGIPLVTSDGTVLGSFCAIDTKPRQWSEGDLPTLRDLAESAVRGAGPDRRRLPPIDRAGGEHVQVLRSLDAASGLVVPLLVGDETLGTLSLVRTSSPPPIEDGERDLGEELGRRAALAVQNADSTTRRAAPPSMAAQRA
jgi:GAF domain-containing protein